MTKVSYLIKTVTGGAVKTESYPKAVEVRDNLRAMGTSASIETVYEKVVERPEVDKDRLEKIKQHFAKKRLESK